MIMSSKQRLAALAAPRSEGSWALLAGVAALLLYLPTLSPSVVWDDGGELQMLSRLLGVAHPTGYPLALLLGWLFTHLPAGDVALRVTLLSTFSSAAAVSVSYLLARSLDAGRTPALLAALTLAAAQRVWMHATATEVYGLANLLMLLGLWLLVRWGRGQAPLWQPALALGLGLTHHISLRLWGPAVLLYLFWTAPGLLRRPRQWLPAAGALLLPLTLYALLPLRAQHFLAQPQWQGEILGIRKVVASGLVTPHYFGGVDNLILALDYGAEFLAGDFLGLSALPQFAAQLDQQFPWPATALAGLGVILLWRRRPREAGLLTVSAVFSLWAALRFLAAVGEDGDNFIPLYLLMGAWLAVAMAWVLESGQRWLRPPWPQRLLLLLLILLPLWNMARGWPLALQRRQVDVRAQAAALLAQPLPTGALLAGEWAAVTPLRYLQRVEGLRPDLWIVATDVAGEQVLWQRAMAADAPYFLLRRSQGRLWLLPAVTVTDAAAISHPDSRRLNDQVRWLGYDLAPASPQPGQALALTLFWGVDATPAQAWSTFIHLLDAQGEKVAQVDRTPLADHYPPPQWQPGQVLADAYELTLPAGLAAGRYQLVFGAYRGDERFDWTDGLSTQPLAEIVIAP